MGQSPTRRRWLRFSLRGLLIVVTLVAVWLGWNVHVVRQRKAALAELRMMPRADITTAEEWRQLYDSQGNGRELSSIRNAMGDIAVEGILLPRGVSNADVQAVAELFPEADVMQRLEIELTHSY